MAKTLFELTEGSAPLLADYALNGEDPANTHVLRRTTWQSIRNLFMGAPTATGDFSVGNSSGVWQKKTLAETQALILAGGWVPVANTWTYASATTITVPSGAAAIYSVGDKWKLTANSVVLQGYIVTVADTLLTVRGNALTNHTFTLPYYSKAASPIGFPHWFATSTPTFTGIDNGSGGAPTLSESRFSIVGRTIKAHGRGNGTKAGAAAYFSMTNPLPLVPANSTDRVTVGTSYTRDAADNMLPMVMVIISGAIYFATSASMADNLVLADFGWWIEYEI